jgi:hypothetical protein
MAQDQPSGKKIRGPSRPFPSISLKEAVKVPQAIADKGGGKPMPRLLVADALSLSPGSSYVRELMAASAKFGLTEGNYSSEQIALTSIGSDIAKPTGPGDRLEGLRAAFRSIPLFAQIIDHFNNSKLPTQEFLTNTLERTFAVPPAWAAEAAAVFIETARYVGLVRDISGSPWVMASAGAPPPEEELGPPEVPEDAALAETADVPSGAVGPTRPAPNVPPAAPQKRQFFVAHGSDQEALGQLQAMLKDLGIPYVVAAQEPHAGRPISQKVADLMRESSGGLFIFSGDEEVTTKSGSLEKRPRLNVVFELGAASLLYGKRIVIFKERDVVFPSNFNDLGYIDYEKGELRSKSLDLLKELIKLGAVQLLPGS